MTGRAGALAWTVAGFAITLFAAGVVLGSLGSAAEGPHLGPGEALLFAAFLTYPVVGAVVASKLPRNAVGWLLLTEGLLFQLVCFSRLHPLRRLRRARPPARRSVRRVAG